jgi:hypothetical protein
VAHSLCDAAIRVRGRFPGSGSGRVLRVSKLIDLALRDVLRAEL